MQSIYEICNASDEVSWIVDAGEHPGGEGRCQVGRQRAERELAIQLCSEQPPDDGSRCGC